MLKILIVEDTPERQEILKRLCKDHAWVLVQTARRAISLLNAYGFDLIWLDYDLAGKEKGEAVAAVIRSGANRRAKVVVHSMNSPGARRILELLPEADLIPLSKITRDNATFKRTRGELARGASLDWRLVFAEPGSGRRTVRPCNKPEEGPLHGRD